MSLPTIVTKMTRLAQGIMPVRLFWQHGKHRALSPGWLGEGQMSRRQKSLRICKMWEGEVSNEL